MTPRAADWATQLGSVSAWDEQTIRAFIRFLPTASHDDVTTVFTVIDEAVLITMAAKDDDLWFNVASRICEWAEGSFEFSFCDVLIGRLEKIYELGDLELKAAATIAAAVLGSSHNRWFVMRRLRDMCGPNCDASTVKRIAIDMLASGQAFRFEHCAVAINLTAATFYHQIIAAAI